MPLKRPERKAKAKPKPKAKQEKKAPQVTGLTKLSVFLSGMVRVPCIHMAVSFCVSLTPLCMSWMWGESRWLWTDSTRVVRHQGGRGEGQARSESRGRGRGLGVCLSVWEVPCRNASNSLQKFIPWTREMEVPYVGYILMPRDMSQRLVTCSGNRFVQATREAKPLQLLVDRASNPKSWIPCIEDVFLRSWILCCIPSTWSTRCQSVSLMQNYRFIKDSKEIMNLEECNIQI